MAGPEPKANKAKLSQKRSLETRRKIVKSALQLWNSRGFDEGFDVTTVEDIADNASVSRATVYYYFPKKEDILRELAWVTAEEVYETALRSMMGGKVVDDVLHEIMTQLGTKVSRSSAAAVKRMLQLRHNDSESLDRDVASGGMTRAFSVVVAHAQQGGELPEHLSAIEVAEMLSSVAMASISKWSILGDLDLVDLLQRRAKFILVGARNHDPR